ncbi:UNVERIFIED_CONTAM: hypothetical protein FKN15_030765 [Acipenser sinensis]
MKETAHAPMGKYSMEYMDISGLSNTTVNCNEIPPRTKEFTWYPDYTGSYPRIPGYIEVPVVPTRTAPSDPRPEALIQMEGYQPWTLPKGWNGPFYCAREQTHTSHHIWKSSLAGEIAFNQPQANVYQHGRKKRMPYTKLQLRELEREYAISKFITKDKRRRNSTSTDLSERQVTIWFQNRRVKDKNHFKWTGDLNLQSSINRREIAFNQPQANVYQHGRKKRMPYTKLQLRELEREYAISKFITKDKRRRNSTSTDLSERQVTIWFQNRRVKDKKMDSKLKDFVVEYQ